MYIIKREMASFDLHLFEFVFFLFSELSLDWNLDFRYRYFSDEFIKYLNIKFCHNLHAQSVKAMRFPRRSYHDALSAEERRQREQEDMELAKEMVDEDDDMFWFFNA